MNKALSATVVAQATSGLTLYIEGKKIEASLAVIKDQLVNAADGETLTIQVPGVGKVTVVKGSEGEATGEQKLVFNKDAFEKLSKARQRALFDDGVVTNAAVYKKEVAAHVRYFPNT